MHRENYLEDVWLNVLKIHDFTLSFICAPADDNSYNNNNKIIIKMVYSHVSRMNGLQKINQPKQTKRKEQTNTLFEILY